MLHAELLRRLERLSGGQDGRIASLCLKLRFDDFTATTAQMPGFEPELAHYRELLRKAWSRGRRPERLVGVGVRFGCGDRLRQLPLDLSA